MIHRYTPFDIKRFQKSEMVLNHFVTVAPMSHNYALCIEYIKKWFYDKFDKDFFGYTYLDGSHVFGELQRLDKNTIIAQHYDDKATCSIVPQIADDSYDRQRLDMNMFGIEQFITTTHIDKSFYQDRVNHRYIMMKMDMLQMNFTFRIKCPSRAMQLDVFKFMRQAFRIEQSETRNVACDYLIPYSLMLGVASDNGFEIQNDRIVRPISFLSHMNRNSFLPILFKHNNMKNKEEFFVRMDGIPVRFAFESLSKDDGNRSGHLSTDFGIEMNINVRFPGMQLYIYHTKKELLFTPQSKKVYNIDNTLMIALHQTAPPPSVNERGWLKYVESEYQADAPGPFSINMDELFEGELAQMIEVHKQRFISPEAFLEIRVYNDGRLMPTVMDWDTMMLSINAHPSKLISNIVIYMDNEYLNTQKVISTGADRMKEERKNNTPTTFL